MALEVSLAEFKNYALFDLWFSLLVQQVSKIAKSVFGYLLLTILFPLALIVAQFVPVIFGRHIKLILPHLPYIKDTKTLLWIKDIFLLYYYSLKEYRRLCLFKKGINSLIDEVDEQIDSIEFFLNNRQQLQNVIESIK